MGGFDQGKPTFSFWEPSFKDRCNDGECRQADRLLSGMVNALRLGWLRARLGVWREWMEREKEGQASQHYSRHLKAKVEPETQPPSH
jgi:hypothetical protein